MADQFVVPQFIDVEDKILGPITARQFVIMLTVLLTEALLFKLFSFLVFLLIGIPLLILGIVFSFVKINGVAFHFFILNMIQTFRKPQLRVWDKSLTDAELKKFITKEQAPPPPTPPRKVPVNTSRLQELMLVVNTGGVYNPEDQQ